MITVYCEGGHSTKSEKPAAWAAIVIGAEEVKATGRIEGGKATEAEIQAGISALQRTPDGAKVHIISTSEYLVKGLTEWRKGWERRGWKNHSGEPVANKNLWERLYALADARRVSAKRVHGAKAPAETTRCISLWMNEA